ncbi:MAG: hypothetical protein WEC75_14070 [Dehalococcoidia bacterium]
MADEREAAFFEKRQRAWSMLNQPDQEQQGIAILRALPTCSNCGLLGQVRKADQQLVPMLAEARCQPPSSSLHDWSVEPLKSYSRMPVCAASLREFPAYADQLDWFQRSEHLDCPMWSCESFIQWVAGLSIKDHKAMLDRQFMMEREDRRDREMREREDNRDRTAHLIALQTRRDMQAREDGRDARLENLQRELHNREMIVLGLVVTVALTISGIAAAILEGAISNGWEPGWWPL